MTRQEFYDHRARLGFERTQGVTLCPAGPPPIEPWMRGRSQHKHYKRKMRDVGQRIVEHPTDLDGTGSIVTRRSTRGL